MPARNADLPSCTLRTSCCVSTMSRPVRENAPVTSTISSARPWALPRSRECRSGEARPPSSAISPPLTKAATLEITQAALGTKVPVRTLEGEVTLNVPAGTQPDSKLRLRGRGVKAADGAQGDHYVIVKVRVPKNLTAAQRRILEEFAKSR